MITVAYITARPNPEFAWFFDSLRRQHQVSDVGQIVIVDQFAEEFNSWSEAQVEIAKYHVIECAKEFAPIVQHVPPKPNVWAGKHRLTPRNWWIASTARNTALCYARGDFIAYLDDRCVLMPTWLDAVREAREKKYAVCGTYEKRIGMKVENGEIVSRGSTIGTDSRIGTVSGERRMKCPGCWMFGCTFGLPVEWMLEVNGFDESWDSVSMEDTHFGQMIENAGYPIFHDSRMKMVEDRSPSESDASVREHDMKRSSKEKHPHDKNDKTHTLIRKLWDNKRASHEWNLDAIRQNTLAGFPFPIPSGPDIDWFDGQPLREMT